MSQTEVCVLGDGRRVKYRVSWRKPRSMYMYVYFQGPDGKRRELSTNETNQTRAKRAAFDLIVQEYRPRTLFQAIGWDDAIDTMTAQMEVQNLRPETVRTYRSAINVLRRMFPATRGPNDITPEMAKQYKTRRMQPKTPGGPKPSAHSVKGDINELNVVFGRWFTEVCGLTTENPFAKVEPPKVDQLEPRLIEPVHRERFETWLSARWSGWRLPLLFLEVKASIGCRISELARTATVRLSDGRVAFEAQLAKGRKTRQSMLPEALFREMVAVAGSSFVFERFPAELRDRLMARGTPHHAKCVKLDYRPERFTSWMEHQLIDFRNANPDVPYFTLHNYRGTAMSTARQAGISYADASIAFGCNPETMRKYYVKLDETAISDSVMAALQTAKKMEE